jgi:two-component system response regulator AtoC
MRGCRNEGCFELADKGTLFLDEIDGIAPLLQAKLLRVLENQSLRRVGGLRDVSVDIRIIAATKGDLHQAVKDGAFRQDLYYRLNVIQIVIPPLRERTADILPLARFFIAHYNQKFRHHIDGITDGAQNLLLIHSWPGNVRELRNVIEHALILEDTLFIRPESLPNDLRAAIHAHAPAASSWASFIG